MCSNPYSFFLALFLGTLFLLVAKYYFRVAPYMLSRHIQNIIILPQQYTASYFSMRVTRFIKFLGFIFCLITFDHLRNHFLFKFILFCHVYIGYTNISFYEQLIFNTFCCTFLYFTIVVLNWYDFTSYSIVLPLSIYDRYFDLVVFFLGVLFT